MSSVSLCIIALIISLFVGTNAQRSTTSASSQQDTEYNLLTNPKNLPFWICIAVLIFLGCLFGCIWIALCVKCKRQTSAQNDYVEKKEREFKMQHAQITQFQSVKSMSSTTANGMKLAHGEAPEPIAAEATETTPPQSLRTPIHSAPASPLPPISPISPPSGQLVINMVPSQSDIHLNGNEELSIPVILPQLQDVVDSHIINESKHDKKKKNKKKSKSKKKSKKKHKKLKSGSSTNQFADNYDYTSPAMRVSSLPNVMEDEPGADASSESDDNLQIGSAPVPASNLMIDTGINDFAISIRSGSIVTNAKYLSSDDTMNDHSLHATAVIPQNHHISQDNNNMAMEQEAKYEDEDDDEYKEALNLKRNKSQKHYRSRTTYSQKAREQDRENENGHNANDSVVSYLASPDLPSDAESMDVDEIKFRLGGGPSYSKDGPRDTNLNGNRNRNRSRISTATSQDDSNLNKSSHKKERKHRKKKSKMKEMENKKYLKTNREDILKVKKQGKNKKGKGKDKGKGKRRRASDVTDISAYSKDGDKSTHAYSDGDDDVYLVNEMEKVFAKNYDVIMMNKKQKQKQERQFSLNLANNLNEEKLIADDIINSMEIDIGSRPLSPLSDDTNASPINSADDETNPIYAAYCGLE